MILINKLTFIVFIWAIISFFCHDKSAYAENEWKLTVYAAKLSIASLGDTLTFNGDYENSYIAVVAVTKRVLSFGRLIDIEVEGQVGKHFGEQNHLEVNALPVIRWLPFPWDAYMDTSFAAGAGLSYAFETPKVELIGVDHSPKLLGYLMLELAFSLPKEPQWGLVARLHHRSGANGLFSNRLDASNAVGFGIKYTF